MWVLAPRKRRRQPRAHVLHRRVNGSLYSTWLVGRGWGSLILLGHRGSRFPPAFQSDDQSTSSSEEEEKKTQRRLERLRLKLLPNPADDPVDSYMVGEIKRVLAADEMYQRHHPELVNQVFVINPRADPLNS